MSYDYQHYQNSLCIIHSDISFHRHPISPVVMIFPAFFAISHLRWSIPRCPSSALWDFCASTSPKSAFGALFAISHLRWSIPRCPSSALWDFCASTSPQSAFDGLIAKKGRRRSDSLILSSFVSCFNQSSFCSDRAFITQE